MPAIRNLTGQKFGRLTALHRSHKSSQEWYWQCRCECGIEKTYAVGVLTSGNSRSCGCLRTELLRAPKYSSVLVRFERLYIPEPNSGCWLWDSAYNDKGYGSFYFPPQNMIGAHIASWRLHRGPVDGLHVLHTCDNRACVNPEHLYLGTHQDNMRDRDSRGRQYDRHGEKNGRAKLTEEQVRAIRADTRWPRFIAADYKTPVGTIKKIRDRRTWTHLK